MLISDWSSDVCSSDLYNWHPMRRRLSPKAAQQRAGEQAYGEGLVHCTCRIVLMTRYVWTAIGPRHSTVSLHRAQTRPPGHAEWNSLQHLTHQPFLPSPWSPPHGYLFPPFPRTDPL